MIMKLVERGVLEASDIFFNGNLKTDRFFYHLLCAGHYYCNGLYSVRRNSLDSYLIIYVKSGQGYVVESGIRYPLQEGEMAILNCYERPSYGTQTGWEILWMHFDGLEIGSLYKSLPGIIVRHPLKDVVERAFEKILVPFQEGGQPTEAITNKYITNLLTEFFESDREDLMSGKGRRFQAVFNYINKNLDKAISLDELAKTANLSKYYFIRAFKKETGMSPHEYIINARVNTAVFFLSATDLSLSEITFKCGFPNESVFNNSFKRYMGDTPYSYKKKSMALLRKK